MEIRDTRNGSWYWVNTAVNACVHITHADKSVYGALASFAGFQEIRPTFETIAKRSNTSIRQAKRSVRSLQSKGYVAIVGYGAKGIANTYTLVKAARGCDKCQIGTTQKKCQIEHEVVPIEAKRSAKLSPHIDSINKEIDSAPQSVARHFVLEEKLTEMEQKENSHLDIIATFIRTKPVRIENARQLSEVIKRYGRIASRLSGAYTNEQIFAAADKIKKDNLKRRDRGDEIDYTLETIYKYLTK